MMKFFLLLAAVQWFSPVSSTNKTDRHYITEIFLKMALNTITKPSQTESWIYSQKSWNSCIYLYMLSLNYDILDYHSIELCFHYNGSSGISFLLQQCIALDDFSEGHSDYWTFGLSCLWTIRLSDYWAFGILDFRTIGLSDYLAFGLLGVRTIGQTPKYVIKIRSSCLQVFSFDLDFLYILDISTYCLCT
jgi:hypothetical protein